MTPERWRQVEELYHGAREQNPSERAVFLAENCQGDEELRREVDSLLDHQSIDGSLSRQVNVPEGAHFLDEVTPVGAGDRFGPYEIEAPIGTGGMGEVFKARDTRLGRSVAIKICSERFSGRFEREARAIAALNHPHICTLFDVGPNYLVMELVDGETLAALLKKRPLPLDQVLRYGAEIADALASAHAHGIIHRDLKPANIMITRTGVKVLDFGLAKFTRLGSVGPGVAGQDLNPATASHQIVGTLSYMAPEQLEGKECDARTDIFALGLILYEMTTGKSAFTGDSQAALIYAVMNCKSPAMGGVPSALARVIQACLSKDPDQRWHSAVDFRIALGWPESPADPQPERIPRKLWFAFGVAALLAGFGASVLLKSPLEPFSYTPLATGAGAEGFPAWSPDGKTIAYSGEVDGTYQIFTRTLSASMPAQITKSTFGCLYPFWSPDGTHVLYLGGREAATRPLGLWSVGTAGGEPELIVKDATAGSISPDGKTLAFLREGDSALWSSSVSGADAKKLAAISALKLDGFLRFSPDGKKIGAWIGDAYALSQFWIFPYPTERGSGKQLGQSWEHRFLRGARPFSWMPDSRHIVFEAQGPGESVDHVWVANTNGNEVTRVTSSNTGEVYPAVSPDGRRVAFMDAPADFDLVEIPVDGGPLRPLISTPRYESWPAWSPLGTQFAYTATRNGAYELWINNPVEKWDRPLVTKRDFGNSASYFLVQPRFSPDGRRLAFIRMASQNSGVWVTNVEGGSPLQLAPEPKAVRQDSPTWSPDGNWIAYVSQRGDTRILAKVRVSGGHPPEDLIKVVSDRVEWSPRGDWITCITKEGLGLISPDGQATKHLSGTIPLVHGWSKDGALVYAVKSDGRRHLMLFSVEVGTGREKTVTDLGPGPLAAVPYQTGIGVRGMSLAPDGKSFAASILRPRSDIWLLDGFETGGFFERFWPSR